MEPGAGDPQAPRVAEQNPHQYTYVEQQLMLPLQLLLRWPRQPQQTNPASGSKPCPIRSHRCCCCCCRGLLLVSLLKSRRPPPPAHAPGGEGLPCPRGQALQTTPPSGGCAQMFPPPAIHPACAQSAPCFYTSRTSPLSPPGSYRPLVGPFHIQRIQGNLPSSGSLQLHRGAAADASHLCQKCTGRRVRPILRLLLPTGFASRWHRRPR